MARYRAPCCECGRMLMVSRETAVRFVAHETCVLCEMCAVLYPNRHGEVVRGTDAGPQSKDRR